MFINVKDFGIKLAKPINGPLEGLQDINKKVLDGSFSTIVCGLPGQGKSWLMESLITQEELYGNKFNFVFIISPNSYTKVKCTEAN